MLIPDNQALDKLVPAVIALSKDEAMQGTLKENIGKLAVTNADSIIAEHIINSLKK